MRMPLVIKFLCYLEAATRMELAGISRPHQNLITNVDTDMEREPTRNYLDPLEGSDCHCFHFRHTIVVIEVIRLAAFLEIKIPKPTQKHLFRCRRSQAGGVSNHYMLHDSKAQPSLCILWYPLHTTS